MSTKPKNTCIKLQEVVLDAILSKVESKLKFELVGCEDPRRVRKPPPFSPSTQKQNILRLSHI